MVYRKGSKNSIRSEHTNKRGFIKGRQTIDYMYGHLKIEKGKRLGGMPPLMRKFMEEL